MNRRNLPLNLSPDTAKPLFQDFKHTAGNFELKVSFLILVLDPSNKLLKHVSLFT